jgi:hypothetical protein
VHQPSSGDTPTSRARRGLAGGVAVGLLFGMTGTAWATNWVPTLHATSAGEAKAQALPTAPGGPAAACTSSSAKTVKISWTAVTKATSYAVYDSTTTVTGTYTSLVTGVTTASWTSGTLSAANYWFEVVAYIGTNWSGTKSAATGESTISSSGCVQP